MVASLRYAVGRISTTSVEEAMTGYWYTPVPIIMIVLTVGVKEFHLYLYS